MAWQAVRAAADADADADSAGMGVDGEARRKSTPPAAGRTMNEKGTVQESKQTDRRTDGRMDGLVEGDRRHRCSPTGGGGGRWEGEGDMNRGDEARDETRRGDGDEGRDGRRGGGEERGTDEKRGGARRDNGARSSKNQKLHKE